MSQHDDGVTIKLLSRSRDTNLLFRLMSSSSMSSSEDRNSRHRHDSVFSLPNLAYSHTVEFHYIAAPWPPNTDPAFRQALQGIATGLELSSLHAALGIWDIDTDTKFRCEGNRDFGRQQLDRQRRLLPDLPSSSLPFLLLPLILLSPFSVYSLVFSSCQTTGWLVCFLSWIQTPTRSIGIIQDE